MPGHDGTRCSFPLAFFLAAQAGVAFHESGGFACAGGLARADAALRAGAAGRDGRLADFHHGAGAGAAGGGGAVAFHGFSFI